MSAASCSSKASPESENPVSWETSPIGSLIRSSSGGRRCLRDRAFHALLRLARSAVRRAVRDVFADPSRLEEHLQAELRDRAELVRWLPLISGILPLAWPDEFTTAMTGEVRAESTFTLIVALLSSVARREGGLVLTLEDAHWMDSVSWALARRVSRDVSSLLLVVSTRPMQPMPPDCEAMLRSPRSFRLIVEPLTSQDTLALVRDRFEGRDPPTRCRNRVIEERAQGNPFFAEESSVSATAE